MPHLIADGANLEPASFVVIENCPEDAGRVEVGVTIPVDRTVHAHQRKGAHVAYDSVVFDRLISHGRASLDSFLGTKP